MDVGSSWTATTPTRRGRSRWGWSSEETRRLLSGDALGARSRHRGGPAGSPTWATSVGGHPGGDAETAGFSIVRDLVGHGIGQHLHEDPQVPNFGVEGRGLELEPGLVMAIEPMVNVGGGARSERSRTPGRSVTIDGSLSAHFEHTVAITESGLDILTAGRRGGSRARRGAQGSEANDEGQELGQADLRALQGGSAPGRGAHHLQSNPKHKQRQG